LDDSNNYVREAALEHPNVTPDHITKALDDPDEYVRGIAIEHPKATAEHIKKALNDPDYDVRLTAQVKADAIRPRQ